MNRFLLLALTAGLLIPNVAKADLGSAEKGMQQQSYDLFCGKVVKKKGTECTVSFDGNRLRVDGGKGIVADQILFTELTEKMKMDGFLGYGTFYFTFKVTYKKLDGTNGYGEFVSVHRPTAEKFTSHLAAFTGKPVGGTDQATLAAKKAAKAQSTHAFENICDVCLKSRYSR